MKIYFEDGELMHTSLIPDEVGFVVSASAGVTRNIEMLDLINERQCDAVIYTNSIFAFNNMYAWSEQAGAPEVYIRTGVNRVFTRIDKLTQKELRRGHNLARMYVAGEFRRQMQ